MALQRIGNYEVLGELGRGGMGVVYRGVDSFIKRPVAIKTIYLTEIQEDHERQFLKERLYREAQSAGILSHPNIVTIYQIGEQDDITFIVMEFVEGKNLAQLLRSAQKPTVETLLSVFDQTAAGLDHAHAQGVIHRDVKPANIIVRPDGVAKITDFGVAKIASQTVTRTGMTLGTPHFMAPEQIQGKPVDGRADQYSLGVVIYEVFTGRKPFTAESMTTLIFRIVTDAVDPKRDNPNLCDAAADVLKRALAKEAGDRYPSCQAMVQAFREAIGLPGTAGVGLAGSATIPSGASLTPGLQTVPGYGTVPSYGSSGSYATGGASATGGQQIPTRTGMPSTLPAAHALATGVQTPTPTPTQAQMPGAPPQAAIPPAPSHAPSHVQAAPGRPPAAGPGKPAGMAALPPRPAMPSTSPRTAAGVAGGSSSRWLFPAVAVLGIAVVLGIFAVVKLLDSGMKTQSNKIASTQGASNSSSATGSGSDTPAGQPGARPGNLPASPGGTAPPKGSVATGVGTSLPAAGSKVAESKVAGAGGSTTGGPVGGGTTSGSTTAGPPQAPASGSQPRTRPSGGTTSGTSPSGSRTPGAGPAGPSTPGPSRAPQGGVTPPVDPGKAYGVPDPGPTKPIVPDAPKPSVQTVFAPPKPIVRVPAIYPAAARRDGVSGTVLLQAVVNEAGQPTSVNVIRGIRPDLDQAARDALAKWRFQPGTADGKPVESRINVEIAFNLVQDQRKPISLKNP